MVLFLFSGHDRTHEFIILFFILFSFHGRLDSQLFKIFFLPLFALLFFAFDDIGIKGLPILSNGKLLVIIHGNLDGLLADNLLFFIMEVFDVPVLESLLCCVSIVGIEDEEVFEEVKRLL
jgi:hypothetical protein